MKNKYKIILLVVIFDLIILGLHLMFGHVSSFFDLDFEHNLPTIYQSAKLLVVGSLAFMVGWQLWVLGRIKRADLLFYGFFAAGFVFLGLDELGQIHEHVDFFVREMRPEYADAQLELAESLGYYSSTWMLYYTPIFVAAAVWFVYAWRYLGRYLPNQRLSFGLMTGFFVMVIIFEFVSNQGHIDPFLYWIYITIEETAEMLGATAGLAVILTAFNKYSDMIKKNLVLPKQKAKVS